MDFLDWKTLHKGLHYIGQVIKQCRLEHLNGFMAKCDISRFVCFEKLAFVFHHQSLNDTL